MMASLRAANHAFNPTRPYAASSLDASVGACSMRPSKRAQR